MSQKQCEQPPMKALTISQPYASLIADGEKWVENRIWPTKYRGLLAIHAGSGAQYLTHQQLQTYPTGAILAVATLEYCINLPAMKDRLHFGLPIEGIPRERLAEVIAHEHAEGPWCWVLKDVQPAKKPIPASGFQRLWNLSESLDKQVRSACRITARTDKVHRVAKKTGANSPV